ncbi:MAG: hypothetical protein KAX09_07480 [Candidatus Heimdallarchaeota archaeon]|nr:hypothetical protein [Candidatus Heimdallarchaeota archaeon]MCK4290809.1 hypothetical protein [Candidatus Heimdallarchaeota archaeon]
MKKQARIFFVLLIITSIFCSSSVKQVKGLTYEFTFEEKTHIESTGGDTFMCEVYDDLAIIIDMDGGLLTYNISNPATPVHLDTFYDGGIPHDFFVEDDLLYLADHHQGLEIYNISNPSNLVKLGQIADLGDGETDGVFVCDNIAYTAEWHDSTWDWSLVLINVTNPSTPVKISEYVDGDNEFHRFYVENEICYASCLTSGFKILNVTNPNSIVEIGVFNNGGYNYDLIIQDNIAWVTSGELEILNLTDLSNPTLINSYSSVNSIFDLEIKDDLAFVVVFQNGVEVVNISSFDDLEKIGEYNDNLVSNLVVTSNLLYVSMHGNGFKIFEYQLSEVTETANMFGITIIFTSLATISLLILIKRKKN